MGSGPLVSWLTALLLALNAFLVWRYLKETQQIRITNEAQLEAQTRPAIVVRIASQNELEFINLGKGPALHVRISATERGSSAKPLLDRLVDDVDFIEAGGKRAGTGIRTTSPGPVAPVVPVGSVLNGTSLQCQYTSLSGRSYWTVVDFDRPGNNTVIATRFY
jgi:hypothetical protein